MRIPSLRHAAHRRPIRGLAVGACLLTAAFGASACGSSSSTTSNAAGATAILSTPSTTANSTGSSSTPAATTGTSSAMSTASTSTASSSGSAGGDAAAGQTVFQANCTTCHGATGQGGNGGPNLATYPGTNKVDVVTNQVKNGGGGMPAFGSQLSSTDIANVAAYITQKVSTDK